METAINEYLTGKILELTGGLAIPFYAAENVHLELLAKDYLKDVDKAALLIFGAEELKPGQKNSLLYDEVFGVFRASKVVLAGWWEVVIRLYAPDLETAETLVKELRNLVSLSGQFKDSTGYWWQVAYRGVIPYKRPSRLEPESRGLKLRCYGWVVAQEVDVAPVTELEFDKVSIESSG